MEDKKQVETVQKILRNRHDVIRESLNVYKCIKCEGTHAGKHIVTCTDKKCRGHMKLFKRIPRSKVEEITSRRAATQCPVCMRTFYVWVENCPYCSIMTIKGKIVKKDKDILAKVYEHKLLT